MGQRGREGGLAETIAAQRLSGTSSPLGGGADAVMDRPTEEDEQRLREALCERRSVGVRCHDSPHDEAARPCLRTFHTASPRTSVNKGRKKKEPGLRRPNPWPNGLAASLCDFFWFAASTSCLSRWRCIAPMNYAGTFTSVNHVRRGAFVPVSRPPKRSLITLAWLMSYSFP